MKHPLLLPLLDRGFLVADVYVRGGGELGHEWHEAGRAINKIRGLEDLADGINALQKNEFGDPKKFVLGGRSAGGTLAAYVANEHPALINTVVLENAFLDIVNTLIDDSLKNSPAKEKSIATGKIISIENEVVTIDVGLKSEGRIPLSEFSRPGKETEVAYCPR